MRNWPFLVLGLLCNLAMFMLMRDSAAQDSLRADEWHVSFRLSGGLAGLDRQLEIASSGELTATDRRRGISVSAHASKDELVRISSLIERLQSVEQPRETVCSDCFVYDITLRQGDRTVTVRVAESSLATNNTLRELVDALTKMMNTTLSR